MNNLWALVIGIERYAGDVVEHAAGALVDVQRIYEWLREIGVPADHIIVLQNEEATRQIIIETFQSHLIDNPRIQDGDPMLLYFSGHGRYAFSLSLPCSFVRKCSWFTVGLLLQLVGRPGMKQKSR
jgi:hypothetical protein